MKKWKNQVKHISYIIFVMSWTITKDEIIFVILKWINKFDKKETEVCSLISQFVEICFILNSFVKKLVKTLNILTFLELIWNFV